MLFVIVLLQMTHVNPAASLKQKSGNIKNEASDKVISAAAENSDTVRKYGNLMINGPCPDRLEDYINDITDADSKNTDQQFQGGEVVMSLRDAVDSLEQLKDGVQNGSYATDDVVNALNNYEAEVQEAVARANQQQQEIVAMTNEADGYIQDIDDALNDVDLTNYQGLGQLEGALDNVDDALGVDTSNP